MDYCSSCCRSLNGALVCPGCGDYAPDIAPPSHRRRSAMAAAATWESWQPEEAPAPEPGPGRYADAGPFGGGASRTTPFGGAFDAAPADRAGTAGTAAAPEDGAPGDAEVPAPTGQGRAARRRQLARWKKHRRRAAAATAFALVGGGLTVSMLQNKPATNGTHAASMPEPERVSTPRTEPAASSTDRADSEASRHPGARPSLPAGRHARPTASTPPPATTARQPQSDTPSHTAAPPRASEPTASTPDRAAHPAHTDAATSAPAAPGSSGDSGSSGSDTSPAHTAPSTPDAPTAPEAGQSSPTHVCLLGVVCVG
ncbi:SCO2400 family protein [Streptomyces sp. FxanaC1]|uniref:SCO2400 family protein n=2 Tax=unclassified Streptomyces TaxID=2593676 RepID=UPI003B636387